MWRFLMVDVSVYIQSYFHRCTVRSVDYLITHTNTCIYIYIYYLRSLKFALKHLNAPRCFDHTIILKEHILFLAKIII